MNDADGFNLLRSARAYTPKIGERVASDRKEHSEGVPVLGRAHSSFSSRTNEQIRRASWRNLGVDYIGE